MNQSLYDFHVIELAEVFGLYIQFSFPCFYPLFFLWFLFSNFTTTSVWIHRVCFSFLHKYWIVLKALCFSSFEDFVYALILPFCFASIPFLCFMDYGKSILSWNLNSVCVSVVNLWCYPLQGSWCVDFVLFIQIILQTFLLMYSQKFGNLFTQK